MKQRLKKLISASVFLVIFTLGIRFIANFCNAQTEGFSVAVIHSDLPNNPDWEIPPLSPEAQVELDKVLSQTFHYLDHGGQSFAFASENKEYVIKFFKTPLHKFHRVFLSLPLPPVFERSRLRKLDKVFFKINRDFTSYKIAYEELQEESGLIYLHLNKGNSLQRSLKIVDKIGISHKIDLDNVEFVVQKYATQIFPKIDELMASGKREQAEQTVHSIVELIVHRCKKGIFDEDPRIHNNLGIIGTQAIFIDVGRFIHDPQRIDPTVYKNDLNLIIDKRFRSWLTKHHPPLAAFLDRELAKIE